MNSRERFYNVTHYKSFDRVFNWEFGYWDETLPVWHEDGLPRQIDSITKADIFFRFDWREVAPINVGLLEGICDPEVLSEEKDHKIVVDSVGIKYKVFKDGSSSIPHYIEFPLKDRETWQPFKERLQPSPKRYPMNWDRYKEKYEKRDYPLGVNCSSLLGETRNFMGFENCAMGFYDFPELMEEMIETRVNLTIATLEQGLKEIQFDFAHFWEDIAFKNGPMISPEMFKKYLVPGYKKITGFLRKHGVDVVSLDCDGDINPIAGMWLDAGVNMMFPLEVGCGTDPVRFRKEYGKDMLLMGGVNKRQLSRSKKEIDDELKRIAKVVEEGGFIPHIDHRCPPDVSYENYLYYLKKKKEMFNIKDWDLEPIERTLKKKAG